MVDLREKHYVIMGFPVKNLAYDFDHQANTGELHIKGIIVDGAGDIRGTWDAMDGVSQCGNPRMNIELTPEEIE